MAYLKYKELTKYFYFYKTLDTKTLPQYVLDYINDKEIIFQAYSTYRDRGIFTNKKIILFDKSGFGSTKQISVIPYKSLSTISILFKKKTATIYIYVDSGYPITLKFISMTPNDKRILRELYTKICDIIMFEKNN